MRRLKLDHFPQPPSNDPDSVGAALEALWKTHDEASASEACDAFLWSMGNNHAGTYYPVVLGVLPEMEQILLSGNPWAQRAAIEALIDLGGSFIPEPGYETYLGGSVQETLKAFVHSVRPHITPFVAADDARARSAIDLLELIDDQAA